METINISVNVKVDLSESTKDFIAKLFNANAPTVKAEEKPATNPTAKPEKPAVTPSVIKAEEKPTAQAAKAEEEATVSIEDVRKVLAEKVNEHRNEIKEKLNEFGAPSVTKLDKSKYQEMYNFLKSL